jgi:hypothetical protein
VFVAFVLGRLATGGDSRQIPREMLGLSHGELGLVTFMVAAILSARFWPRMGEWVAKKLTGGNDGEHERTHEKRS